jgi:hypothetical protein
MAMAVATGGDVQAYELRATEGAGEAQEQQRTVPGAQEVVRQLRQHVAQVCNKDRGLTLLCGPRSRDVKPSALSSAACPHAYAGGLPGHDR